MFWKNDPFWQETFRAAQALSPAHSLILTPDEFVKAREAFFPLRQAKALARPDQITGMAVKKDAIRLLPIQTLRAIRDGTFRCVFANEVFVLYSSLEEGFTLQAGMEEHVSAFSEHVKRLLRLYSRRGVSEDVLPLPYLLDGQRNRVLKKLLPHKQYVAELFEDLSHAPEVLRREVFRYCVTNVQLEISAFCNRSCDYCPVRFLGRKDPEQKMPWEIFQACIEDLRAVDYRGCVLFSMFNEPLYDREWFLRALEFAEAQLPHCTIRIVTNGDFLTEAYFHELTAHRIEELSVSVHYAGRWDKALQKERIREILRRIGVEELGALDEEEDRLIYYVDPRAYDSEKVKQLVLRTEDFAVHGTDRGNVLTEGICRYKNLDYCDNPATQLNVAWDGTVMPCCNMCSDVPALREFAYGKIQKPGDLFSVYTGGAAARFRRSLFAPRGEEEPVPDACRTCSVAACDGETRLYRLENARRREIYDCWLG